MSPYFKIDFITEIKSILTKFQLYPVIYWKVCEYLGSRSHCIEHVVGSELFLFGCICGSCYKWPTIFQIVRWKETTRIVHALSSFVWSSFPFFTANQQQTFVQRVEDLATAEAKEVSPEKSKINIASWLSSVWIHRIDYIKHVDCTQPFTQRNSQLPPSALERRGTLSDELVLPKLSPGYRMSRGNHQV